MKISTSPVYDALRTISQVRSKSDGVSSGNPQQQYPQQGGKEDAEESPEQFEQKLDSAIEKFKEEAKANGLDTQVSGDGPGLRVTLTDGSGAVVRQFTGEEFVKMREGSHDGRRGKILDQKL